MGAQPARSSSSYDRVPTRRRFFAIGTLLAQVAALLAALVIVGAPAEAGSSAVMFGYVPLPANDFDAALKSISTASATPAGTTIDFTVGVTNAAASAHIYYDQWEDGYEADISNPTQSTTLVLGDGNTANGNAATYCGAVCAGDTLPQGAALIFRNNISTPRAPATQLFDGGDKIASTRGFTITAGGFPTNVGSVLAGVVSSYDTTKYSTDYTTPVGENTPSPSGTSPAFSYTGLDIQAATDGTVVTVDKDANGTTDVTQTINEGQTVFIDGGVKQGATVHASSPVQVHLITGDKTTTVGYESRTYTLFPDNLLSNDYLSPAGSSTSNFRTINYLFNPSAAAITVTPTCTGCAGTINVPAKASAAYSSPLGQAVEFKSASNFIGVAGVGAQSGALPGTSGDASSSWDWGYTMVPMSQLTTQVVLAWAPGNSSSPPSSAASGDYDDDPVWVTSTKATTINVDFDGDPSTGTLSNADCFGAHHDQQIAVSALSSTRIFDPNDGDMTGARIYTCDGTLISGAWGEDSANAPATAPGFDAGYTIIPSTTMLVNKTAAIANDANGDGKFGPGDTMTYDIEIADAGSLAFTNVKADDNLPSGLTYVPNSTIFDDGTTQTPLADDSTPPAATIFPLDEAGVSVPNISAGATVHVRFQAQIKDPFDSSSAVIGNSACVTAQEAAACDSMTTGLVQADLSLTTTQTGTPQYIGDNAVFHVAVTNSGPDGATGVDVTDVLPANTTYVSSSASQGSYDSSSGVWTVGTIASGATKTLDITATVGALSVEDFAQVTAAEAVDPDSQPAEDAFGPGNPANQDDEGSVVVTVQPSADLSVAKTLQTAPTYLGDNAVYKITVTNAGPSDATGVAVTDQLPSGLTYVSDDGSGAYNPGTGVWAVGSVASGASKSLLITATVNALTTNNTADITASDQHDPDATNNSASRSATVAPLADLSLTQSASPTSVLQEGQATYTLTLHNSGPSDATGIVVHDTMPAGVTFVGGSSSQPSVFDTTTGDWSIASLASGASISQDIVVNVDTTGSHTNDAEVKAVNENDPDSTPNNHVATEDDQASADVVGNPLIDLSVTDGVSSSTANVGTNVTYTVTVTNGGPSDATGVDVTDKLPAGITYVSNNATSGSYDATTGVWNVGGVPNGATQTLHIVGTVNAAGSIDNFAEVTAAAETDVDSQPAENALDASNLPDQDDEATNTITGVQSDLSLSQTAAPSAVDQGGNATYTVTVHNGGPSGATGVRVADTLPAGVTYVSNAPSQGTFDSSTGVWTVGSVANGNAATLDITVRIDTAGAHDNVAEVSASDQPDPDSTPNNHVGTEDDQASASVTGNAIVDLSVTDGASSATTNVGSNVTYTLVVSNGGPSDATGVSLRDVLPAGALYVTSDATQGSYDAVTGTWNVGAVANGASKTMHITARILTPAVVDNFVEVIAANEKDADSQPAENALSALNPPDQDDEAMAVTNGAQIDLAVQMTATKSKVDVGNNVTYTISLTNSGPSNATAVWVKDLVPSGLAYVSSAPAQGSYSSTTDMWNVGNVAVGQTIVMEITASVQKAGTFVNTAQVWGATQPDVDSTPANSVATEDDQASTSVDGVAPAVTAPKPDPAGVSGSLWLDLNSNGKADANEPMMPGVTIELLDPSGTVVATAVTDSFGHYSFGNVAPGTYRIVIDRSSLPAAATTQTYDPDSLMDGAHSVTLGSGAGVGGINFGYDPPAAPAHFGPVKLPITGANLMKLVEIAGVLLLAGACMIAVTRRRRRSIP